MSEKTPFEDQPKRRKAEFITPPNVLKQKVGSGGIDEKILAEAQQTLEDNTTDFKPIAADFIHMLNQTIQRITQETTRGEPAIEALIYPAMQLKAHGSMFHFPLVTAISDILINFLETIDDIDDTVLEIVTAHQMTLSVVISTDMTGDGGAQGQSLKTSLLAACSRYYKTRKVNG